MEKDKSDSILMYCIIIFIVLVAIAAMIFISFTDFSGDSNVNTDIAVEEPKETPKKKTNTIATEEENIVEDEIVDEEPVEEEQVEEEYVDEEPIEEEIVEEEPLTQEELDAQAVLSDSANNPLNALEKLGGNTVVVTADRIVLQQDNPAANIYFQFDENDVMLGLFLEYQAEDPMTASTVAGVFAQMLQTEDVNIDGNMVLVKYPFSEDLKVSKDEAIKRLSTSFNIKYE